MQNKWYIDGILNGDTAVISSIYEQYAPRITSLVLNSGGKTMDAEDIFQDALLVIYQKAKSPNFELTAQFYSYLFGICQRLWFNKRKKKVNQEQSFDNSNFDLPDENDFENKLIEIEKKKLFDECIAQLSPKCNTIMTMNANNLSIKEINVMLAHKSEGYTRLQKSRCKQKLIGLIKAHPKFNELYGNPNKITKKS